MRLKTVSYWMLWFFCTVNKQTKRRWIYTLLNLLIPTNGRDIYLLMHNIFLTLVTLFCYHWCLKSMKKVSLFVETLLHFLWNCSTFLNRARLFDSKDIFELRPFWVFFKHCVLIFFLLLCLSLSSSLKYSYWTLSPKLKIVSETKNTKISHVKKCDRFRTLVTKSRILIQSTKVTKRKTTSN